ncbi:MAG: hypothetical protein TECD_00623 [Hyphomicrobiaceae bacterium hypho_1]
MNSIMTEAEISEIVEMAWCDHTSFDMIFEITGLSETQVIKVMRSELKPKSFRMWRKRVSGRINKHSSILRAIKRDM